MGTPFDDILNPDQSNFSYLDSFQASENSSGMEMGVTRHADINVSPSLLSNHSPALVPYQYNFYASNSSTSLTSNTHHIPMNTSEVKKPTPPPTHQTSTSRSYSYNSSSSSNKSSSPPKSPNSTSKDPSASSSAGEKKRTLNTLAARRYRQRRIDQVTNLEVLLKETRDERDGLKERVARLEGELDVLRRLVGKN